MSIRSYLISILLMDSFLYGYQESWENILSFLNKVPSKTHTQTHQQQVVCVQLLGLFKVNILLRMFHS